MKLFKKDHYERLFNKNNPLEYHYQMEIQGMGLLCTNPRAMVIDLCVLCEYPMFGHKSCKNPKCLGFSE